MPGGVSPSFTVEYLASAQHDLTQILLQATAQGNLDSVWADFLAMDKLLQHDARTLGEETHHYRHLKLVNRHTVARSISVQFAVHENKPLVFVRTLTKAAQVDDK